MNELIFFFHIVAILSFLAIANRYGKEALISFFCVSALFANVFVTKQIDLFGANVTCTDAFAVSCMISLNLLQEKYGKALAKKAIWIAFMILSYFTLMSQIHLFYTPNHYDQSQSAFEMVFAHTPRLLAASLGVAFIVQRIDVHIFGLIKSKFPTNFFFRFGGAFLVSQMIDTMLFSLIGLKGLVANIVDIMIVSFFVKLAIFFLMSPLTKYLLKIHQKKVFVNEK